MDDLASIERLQEENQKILEHNTKNQETRNTLKKDYEELHKKLSTLADRTTHPVMIPIGSVGYFPGTLIHTNEIMVLLGDNWFVERSTKQAMEIVNRRIEMIDQQLTDLSKEYDNVRSHLDFTKQFQEINQEHDGIKEIKEELPPEDIPSSLSKGKRRIAHKPKHNLYQRKVDFTKPTKTTAENNTETKRSAAHNADHVSINHDELLARLNQLEKEEQEDSLKEHEETMKLLMGESEDVGSTTSHDKTHNVRFNDEHSKRHVKFESDTLEDTSTNLIKFSHTNGELRPRSASESDVLYRAGDINSPADIYERFTQKSDDENTRPLKSILKKDSRSNSTENLKLKPILKTSPEHRPDTPENVLDDPKPILKTPPDTQGSDRRPGTPDYITLDEPKPILKSTVEIYSNNDIFIEEPKPILKSHEVHFDDESNSEDYIPPVIDLSQDDTTVPILHGSPTKRSVTPDDDRKSILKTSNKINLATNFRPTEIVNDYKPILKNNFAVSENVIERTPNGGLFENQPREDREKPVSRFKASRLKR